MFAITLSYIAHERTHPLGFGQKSIYLLKGGISASTKLEVSFILEVLLQLPYWDRGYNLVDLMNSHLNGLARIKPDDLKKQVQYINLIYQVASYDTVKQTCLHFK